MTTVYLVWHVDKTWDGGTYLKGVFQHKEDADKLVARLVKSLDTYSFAFVSEEEVQ